MLRILFISLVVANLLLLAFQSDSPAPAAKPETRATRTEIRDTNIPTIHLFSEIMEDQGLLSSNRQCFTLGPFHSIADKDDTRTRLLEVANHISERQTEALVEKGYWIFMPPYASLLEANKALLSLQALGLEDVAIIYDGDWKNAISLGYFLRQENARQRKQDLEDRGFAAKIRIQRQAEPRYWLDYEQSPGSGLIALNMQDRPNDFMQRPLPCPEQDFAEDSDDALQTPEQAPLMVAEAVSQAPDQAGSADTGTVVKTPGPDNSGATTGVVSQAPEEIKPAATDGVSKDPVLDDEEDTGTVSEEPEAVRTEDAGVTPQTFTDYLPRPKASAKDDGSVTGQDEEAATAEATDGEPVEGGDASPDEATETSAVNGGEDSNVD